MTGENVTILQFATTSTAPVAGDRFAAWQTSASQTVQFLATQVTAYVFSTDVALTNQTTATAATAGAVTLATGAAGYVVISVNGTSYKVPIFAV